MPNLPRPTSTWEHTNGNHYAVLFIANEFTERPDQYPQTVVYKGENGRVWSRPVSDWARSMTLVKDAEMAVSHNEDELTVFEEPTGGLKAALTSRLPLPGRLAAVAHALVYIDRAPSVNVTLPSNLALAELALVNNFLPRFESQLHDLVAAFGPQSAHSEPSSGSAIRQAAAKLVREHLDEASVHPCDVNDDDARARQCRDEVQVLYRALNL